MLRRGSSAARARVGAFGSFGVGSVEAGEGGAVVTEARVDRVLALPAGSRSPVFALRSSKRFARYSWFMRLAQTRLGDSDLAGIAAGSHSRGKRLTPRPSST